MRGIEAITYIMSFVKIASGLYVLYTLVGIVIHSAFQFFQANNEREQMQYDLKIRNMIISLVIALFLDDIFIYISKIMN